MKSILHVITTIERGGAENQLLVLVNEQIRLGYKVSILPLKGRAELLEEFEAIGAQVILKLANVPLFFQFFMARRMRSLQFDVVHAHLPRAELLSIVFFSTARLISTKHNAEIFFPKGPQILSKMLARVIYYCFDSTICISNSVKRFLVEHGEIPNSPIKTKVIFYGTPQNPLEGNSLSKPPTYNNDSRIRLGTVSRLEAQKDLHTLIRAFSKFKEIYPFATCEIIGAGSQLRDLQVLARNLGVADSVEFLGKTAFVHSKILSWDFFILTSKYEGFGMVLLEALQCGRPIIAANNSAIPEVLGPEYPWLFNTADVSDLVQKILDLVQNSQKFDFLELAENRLNFFDSLEMAKKTDAVYWND